MSFNVGYPPGAANVGVKHRKDVDGNVEIWDGASWRLSPEFRFNGTVLQYNNGTSWVTVASTTDVYTESRRAAIAFG